MVLVGFACSTVQCDHPRFWWERNFHKHRLWQTIASSGDTLWALCPVGNRVIGISRSLMEQVDLFSILFCRSEFVSSSHLTMGSLEYTRLLEEVAKGKGPNFLIEELRIDRVGVGLLAYLPQNPSILTKLAIVARFCESPTKTKGLVNVVARPCTYICNSKTLLPTLQNIAGQCHKAWLPSAQTHLRFLPQHVVLVES